MNDFNFQNTTFMKTNIAEKTSTEDSYSNSVQDDDGKLIGNSKEIISEQESHSKLSGRENKNKSPLPKYELEMRVDGLFVTDPTTGECYKAIPLINLSSISADDYVIKTSNGYVYFRILCELSGKIRLLYI